MQIANIAENAQQMDKHTCHSTKEKNIVSVSNLCEKAKQKKKVSDFFFFSFLFPSQLFSQTVNISARA